METVGGLMVPLFIYKSKDKFLVREINDDFMQFSLIASIDAALWLTVFLNHDKKNRDRMVRELKGRE
jgi:hypothetical protein